MTSIHIKNAFVATMDKHKQVYQSGEVLIEDGHIVEVGKKV